MRTSVIVLFLLVVLLAADKPNADDVRSELKKLQGTWSLVREIEDGKEMPAEEAKKLKLHFDRQGNWKVTMNGNIVGKGTSSLDLSKKPKAIDYTFTQGEQKGTKFIAIYELAGDSYKHCGVLKGARPSEFASKPGSGHTLTIFRREKK